MVTLEASNFLSVVMILDVEEERAADRYPDARGGLVFIRELSNHL